jgi:hypothetical protein
MGPTRAPLTTYSAEKRRRGENRGHKSHFFEIPRCLPPARVAFRSGHGKLLRWSSRERAGTITHDMTDFVDTLGEASADASFLRHGRDLVSAE